MACIYATMLWPHMPTIISLLRGPLIGPITRISEKIGPNKISEFFFLQNELFG